MIDAYERIAQISSTLLSEDEDLDATLRRIGNAVHDIFPDTPFSYTLVDEHGDYSTHAASRPEMAELENLQYRLDAGPCIDAIKTSSVIDVESFEDAPWAEFADAARSLGMNSALALPLRTSVRSEGSLNLFSPRPHAFTTETRNVAQLLAHQAAFVVANVALYRSSKQLATQLQEAMESRSIIEQAKGVLMMGRAIDESEAFGNLRSMSQSSNMKVRDLAERIVASAAAGRPLFDAR